MNLPKYIFATWPDGGAGCIINTDNGHIGRIVQFMDYTELLTQTNSGKWVAFSIVPGYKIVVFYAGIIAKGNVLIGTLEDAQADMSAMSHWYYEEKIISHASRFKRYLL